MLVLTTILIIVASIMLILIVLVQNPKGGGLSASFGGGGNQFGGVAQTNKFLDKATWTLAIVLLVLSIMGSFFLTSNTQDERIRLQEAVTENEISTQPVESYPTKEELESTNPEEKLPDTKPENE